MGVLINTPTENPCFRTVSDTFAPTRVIIFILFIVSPEDLMQKRTLNKYVLNTYQNEKEGKDKLWKHYESL